jgi:hypothetical protein
MGFQRCVNIFKDSIDVLRHVVVPVTKNEIAHSFQDFCSLRVGFCPNRMLTAVQFDDQASVGTKEIDNESVDWKLSSEFPTAKTTVA